MFYLQVRLFNHFKSLPSTYDDYVSNHCVNLDYSCPTTPLDVYNNDGCTGTQAQNFYSLFPYYGTTLRGGSCECLNMNDFEKDSDGMCREKKQDGSKSIKCVIRVLNRGLWTL